PWDFTPTGAIALFAGATFQRRSYAFALPFIALLISDAVIGFHSGMPVVYAAFALSVCIGYWIRERRDSVAAVATAAVASATLFYISTNFWVWAAGHATYDKTFSGLVACYVAAIPFYVNHLAGDLFYSMALFGAFVWTERRFPVFAESAQRPGDARWKRA
ncbi:MAG TPA: DUF6580 family putative transport protein, partial [Kofleriaceae bacterium]